ncbi:MAG: beta-lactamase family protein, partial [Candidatus Eisenbacteria bacterium]|nr:beta-lactamase family protein [Candidatus Eisenbacteria bacterium]
RHLLSHSSGIGDYWTDYYDSHGRQVTTLAEMLPFVYKEIRDDGLYFEPGSAHRYSNSGFVLLGLVIEQVTGQSYYDAVAERIYRPLGLDHTDSYLYGSSTDLAQPMIRDESAPEGGAARWAEAPHGRRGTSAGGGYSTLDDMLRFARGLVGGAIVPRPVLAEMATMQPPIEEDFYGYGLGFLVQRSQTGGKLSFGHGGIAHGINFELRYFPSEDVTLVAFGNQDNGAYDDLRRNLVKLITGDR